MIDGLTEFLLARIAEREASAQQEVAEMEEWFSGLRVEYRWLRLYWRTTKHDVPSSAFVDGAPSPARVLAECDAKRRIVEMHTETDTSWLNADGKLAGPDEDRVVYCKLCSFHEQYEGFNNYEEPSPCPTLRILALPDADHPDWRDEWRP